MPFARPSLTDLVTRIRSDFRGRLGITGSLLRRAMADTLAVVWAGASHLFHGHLDWLSEQLFPFSAEQQYLYAYAAAWGITPTAATFAAGNVTATGTNGSPIPIDTILVRDDGVTYKTTAAATIASGTATVPVQAVTAGDDGNMDAGDSLAFQSPVPGVNSTVTIAAGGLTGGNDVEGVEEVRDRLLLRLQEPPTGGSDQDYLAWTLAVAGVTRAWVYRHENGLGTVVVRFVRDLDASIIPDAGEVAAVQAALDAERPTTAEVTAAAPVELPVNFTIQLTPNTAAVQAAVESELKDMFTRDSAPGDGAGLGTIYLSRIQTAIGIAEGVTNFVLTEPAANVVPAVGQLPVLGVITWA